MHPKDHTDEDIRWDKLKEYKEEGYYIAKSEITEMTGGDGLDEVEFYLRLERVEEE